MRGQVTVRFKRSVSVPVGPSEAFRLADMAHLEDWNPAVRRSALESGTALCIGAEYVCAVANGPVRITAHPRLVEVEPQRLVVYEGQFGPARSRDSIHFAPDGLGTRLTFLNVTSLPPWAGPLRRLIAWVFHRQANRAVDGAVAYLAARR